MSGVILQLHKLHESLSYIKEYLGKLGPNRRQQDVGLRKFDEAKNLYCGLDNILSQLHEQIESEKISPNDITSLNKIINEIHILYNKITNFSVTSTSKNIEQVKMADFDLKTAIALLPVMTGQESITNSLINGIELYDKMISESSKHILIEFVLKTRLSQSAQLRMKSSYNTVNALLTDMKTHLLPKKSDVAIQWKLNHCKQGCRSIEAFGSELENLFVSLTIAQSNGNSSTYDILKPINEKIAIKRFADGLTDRRLSTIISARQFESLPHAIRTAIDEQSLSSAFEVMNIRRNPNRGRNYYAYNNNYFRGNNNNQTKPRGKYSNNYSRNSGPPMNAHQGQYRPPRPRGENYYRGFSRGTYYSSRSRRPAVPVRHTTQDTPTVDNRSPQGNINDNYTNNNASSEFFR